MIAFLIKEIDVRGGTHKQFLKLIEYAERQGLNYVVITKKVDYDKTYPNFAKFKHKIIVFNPNDYPVFLRHRIIWRIGYFIQRIKLRRLLKGIDIINVHDNGWTNEMPLFANKKVYWQVNDLPYEFNVGVYSKMTDDKHKRQLRAKTLKNIRYVTDYVVNVSKNAKLIKECFGRDAHVFYCGVEPIIIERHNFNTFERFAKKQLNLLTSGVFFPYRNYEVQIEVVKLLRKLGIDVRLNIIGDLLDEEYANKITTIINEGNLANCITIEGQVDEEKFKLLHKNSDIFLFVNIDQSWGLAVFEAMSCGLPVIVSESVGATEILNNNINALFVDPKDPEAIVDIITQLMNRPDLYENISYKARLFHKDWTWDNAYCSKMIKLITGNEV